jgi:hypothetical protein
VTASVGATPRNPFATRHTRPGCLLPRDARGEPLDLAALLATASSAVAIEGPHGAGKTNLLTALADRLAAVDRLAALLRPRTPWDGATVLRAVGRSRPGTTLCIDSWECIGPLWATLVRWAARRRHVGLVVTSHRPTGMPTVVRCDTTPTLLGRLVRELPDHGGLVDAADVDLAFRAHGGNIREALYDLYDRFEWRSRKD